VTPAGLPDPPPLRGPDTPVSRWLLVGIVLVVAAVCFAIPVLQYGIEIVTRHRVHRWIPILGPILGVTWLAMVIEETVRGRRTPIWTAAIVGIAIAILGLHHGTKGPEALVGKHTRDWSQFHYYLGAKYFPEVGYFDLYSAVLAADDERLASGTSNGKKFNWEHIKSARDMHTYKVEDRATIVGYWDRANASEARFKELGRDSRFFRRILGKRRSGNVVKDMGFNPAPPWLLVGRPFAEAFSPGDAGWWLVSSSDVWMHLIVIASLLWGFGLRTGALCTAWLHCIPLNETLVFGGLFNFAWLAGLVLGYVAYHKDKPVLAGIAWGISGMFRIFPGLMAMAIVVPAAWDFLRRRTTNTRRFRFAVTFCVTCALLLAASHTTGRGLQTWPEWKEKMELHTAHHPTSGARRVGLGKLARHTPSPRKFWRAPRWVSAEHEAMVDRRKVVVTLVGALLLLLAMRGRSDEERVLLLLFAVWILTTSSRYYASAWVLLFTLPQVANRGSPRFVGRWAPFILLVILAAFYSWGTYAAQYLALNYMALAMFVGMCGLFVLARGPQEPAEQQQG